MGYVSGNLRLLSQDIGGKIAKRWTYNAVADNNAAIVGASYFADGAKQGMAVGDLVDVVATGPLYKLYQVSALSGDAATVTAPSAIT